MPGMAAYEGVTAAMQDNEDHGRDDNPSGSPQPREAGERSHNALNRSAGHSEAALEPTFLQVASVSV